MQFQIQITPQYREAGADGLIGLKGFLCYCQDVATWHMHSQNLGNDRLIDEFNIAWMYTKYQIRIYKKADFSGPLVIETGATGIDKVKVERDFRISRDGVIYAEARLECCLYNINENKLCKIRDIGFDEKASLDNPLKGLQLLKLSKDTTDMERKYDYMVLYSDLDKSRHMNNLRYIDVFMDAFDPDFHEINTIKKFSINFISQARFKDVLTVMSYEKERCIKMAALGPEKITAAAEIEY